VDSQASTQAEMPHRGKMFIEKMAAKFYSPPEDKSIRLRDGSILKDAIA